jgi:hypothetical protein
MIVCRLEEQELIDLLPKWQKITKTQDWNVRLEMADPVDLGDRQTHGDIRIADRCKSALIRILDPDQFDDVGIVDYDAEKTLVHELVHLHFVPFQADEGTAEETAQEQAIDTWACTLVDEHRRSWRRNEGQKK